jgi:hypothetical protein
MRRFVAVKGQDSDWHVIDLKSNTPRILCVCIGFKAPLNAEYICDALEAYHSDLYRRFNADGE